jgi:hypothetical protein
MTDLKKVEKKANELKTVENVNRELKRIASAKCRLKKQKGRADYSDKMTEILQQEQLLKEVRQLIDPKEKPVTQYEQADVDNLDYDETIKAIRSIQSKKTLSRWLTDADGDNDEFRNAVRIEKMLIARREAIKPVDKNNVRKTEIQTIIDTIESSGKLSQEKIIELLKNVIQ